MTRAARKQQSLGLPELSAPTSAHDWYERIAREKEHKLRERGIFAHDVIQVLRPVGHDLFENGDTVYHHILRTQTQFGRAFVLSELDAAIRAGIIHIGPR